MTATTEDASRCEHKFLLLGSAKKQEYGEFHSLWTRIDYFFCEKCLEQQERKREESSRGEPLWWTAR